VVRWFGGSVVQWFSGAVGRSLMRLMLIDLSHHLGNPVNPVP
jgi:hypothetical protein